MNLGETPVSEAGDNGRDELSDAEGNHQGSRGTFHEEEAMGTGDEDQGLRDDGNLEVDNHMELTIINIDWGSRSVLEGNTKFVLEEVGLKDDDNKSDAARQALKQRD